MLRACASPGRALTKSRWTPFRTTDKSCQTAGRRVGRRRSRGGRDRKIAAEKMGQTEMVAGSFEKKGGKSKKKTQTLKKKRATPKPKQSLVGIFCHSTVAERVCEKKQEVLYGGVRSGAHRHEAFPVSPFGSRKRPQPRMECTNSRPTSWLHRLAPLQ